MCVLLSSQDIIRQPNNRAKLRQNSLWEESHKFIGNFTELKVRKPQRERGDKYNKVKRYEVSWEMYLILRMGREFRPQIRSLVPIKFPQPLPTWPILVYIAIRPSLSPEAKRMPLLTILQSQEDIEVLRLQSVEGWVPEPGQRLDPSSKITRWDPIPWRLCTGYSS